MPRHGTGTCCIPDSMRLLRRNRLIREQDGKSLGYSNQKIQVNVHISSKTIAPVSRNGSIGKYPERNLRVHWRHQRNLLSKAYADSVYTTYCAICRYIRRHILPSAKRLELDPKWHVDTHGSTQYTIPSRLVKAYIFFQMYGGHSNFSRAVGGAYWKKPQPDPEPVSPFAFDWRMSSAPWPLQHPEGGFVVT